MEDLNDKAINGSLPNDEWNGRAGDVQRVVEAFAVLSGSGDDDQLGQAIAAYAAASQFYTCSGPVNAYIATPISGIKMPFAYTDGMVVRMRPNINNTTASTVKVGGLGVKSIVKEDETAIIAGVLNTAHDAYLRYDSSLGKFKLSNWSSNADVSLSSSDLTSGHLIRNSGSVIRLYPGANGIVAINIDGVVVTSTDFIEFDIATDLETGGETASTAYYLYVENVAGVITPHISVTTPHLPISDVKTGYHSVNDVWKCVGSVWNDVGSDFTKGIWDGNGNFVCAGLRDTDHEYDLAMIANNTVSSAETLNIPLCCASVDMALAIDGNNDAAALMASDATDGTVAAGLISSPDVLIHVSVESGAASVREFNSGKIPIIDMSTPEFTYAMDDNGTANPSWIRAVVNGWADIFASKL